MFSSNFETVAGVTITFMYLDLEIQILFNLLYFKITNSGDYELCKLDIFDC